MHPIGLKDRNVIPSMFTSVAVAMILTNVLSVLATIIDGMITSQFLGSFHYTSISLLSPIINFFLLFTAATSTGCQIVCSKAIGVGNRDEANASFTYSLIYASVMALIIILVCIFFPTLLFRITGVTGMNHQYLYEHMLGYLHGYMPGIPFMILVQVMGPIVVMDGGKSRFTISSLVFVLTDVTGDLLNVLVFNGDVFGMGMATSISYFVQFVIIVLHFVSKKSYFKLSLKNIKWPVISDIGKAGNPTTVKKMFSTTRDIVINRINLSVALSAAALVARSMQTDLNTLMLSISVGIGNALLAMTGIYFSAQDRHGLKTLFSFSFRFATVLSGTACVVLLIIAPLIARSYTGDSTVLPLSIFSIRCMALSIPLETLNSSFQSYLQGIRKAKYVNGISFFECLVIPILAALYLARIFGSKGVLASMLISKVFLLLVMLVIIIARNRHFPKDIYDWMLIPKTFGGTDENNIYFRIKTMDDVVKARDASEQFCLNHGIDQKRAMYSALFIEEMAGNVVLHGKRKKFNSICCDFRLFIVDDKVSITLRDYCRQFDPARYIEVHPKSQKGLGIRIVKNLSSEFRYFSAFNSNNVIIVIDR